MILQLVQNLLVHVRAIRGRTIGEDDRAERSIVDHMHIIEALEARDASSPSGSCATTPSTWRTTSNRRPTLENDPEEATTGRGEGDPNVSATKTQSANPAPPANGQAEPGDDLRRPPGREGPEAEGIDVIFTLCGGHIIDIYDGCIDEGIDVVDVRHEQVAAHAADGYARVTGKPGCAVVTAGPARPTPSPACERAARGEPDVLIGGQGALNQHKMGSLQDLPHVDMMAPITKFAATVPHTARVADIVRWRSARLAGAPGPVVPGDPARRPGRQGAARSARIPEAGHYRASTWSSGDPAGIEKLADLLVHAKKPAILLGSQVWTDPREPRQDIDLVRTLNIQAYMNGAGRGTLPPGDPHHFHLSPPLRVQQRRRDRHRRHAVRLPDGLRQAPLARTRPWSRSTWTTGPSARTATSTSASSATPG